MASERYITVGDIAALVKSAEALVTPDEKTPQAFREMVGRMTDYQVGMMMKAMSEIRHSAKVLSTATIRVLA